MAEWIVAVELVKSQGENVKTEQRVYAINGTSEKSIAFRAMMSFIDNNVLHIFFNDLERVVKEEREEAIGRLTKVVNKSKRRSKDLSSFRLDVLRELNIHIHSIKQVR